MVDMIIRGGRVVTPSDVGNWEVAIEGEKIVAVAETGAISPEGAKVVDASGRVVVPGGIEPHAHIGEPGSHTSGAEVVSRAAIHGGTTTVLDFAGQGDHPDLQPALDAAAKRWQASGYTDYSYHPMFASGVNADVINQIPELIQAGYLSFKIFTTSRVGLQTLHGGGKTWDRRIFKTDFGRLAAIMQQIADAGGMLLVHAEDEDIVQYNYSLAKERGQWDWWNMHLIHDNLSEDISFRRVIRLAEKTGCPIYFVHVSAREGVDAIGQARDREQPVYGETLHNYACFNSDDYREENGMQYHTYPSLKSPADANELWAGLLDGRLSTVGTDLVSTTWEDKIRFRTVADVIGGHNGIETRVGIIYTEGVVKRGMSLRRFVDVTSANAAKIFGLYPRKGAIAAGSDADITIIDPSVRGPLLLHDLHLLDYSPWEGWDIHGWPATTILRGRVMVENGKLLGSPGHGQLLTNRSITSDVRNKPVC